MLLLTWFVAKIHNMTCMEQILALQWGGKVSPNFVSPENVQYCRHQIPMLTVIPHLENSTTCLDVLELLLVAISCWDVLDFLSFEFSQVYRHSRVGK